MDTGIKRSFVSLEQLNTLIDFMKEHPDLAKGHYRGKVLTTSTWNVCAKKLNNLKPGTVKNGRGWSKFWSDWKYRVRRHALELKVAKDTNTVGLEAPAPLSAIEEKIISIIGDDSIEGVVIKKDPLEDLNEELDTSNDNKEVPRTRCYSTRSKRKRRHSSKDISDIDDTVDSPPDVIKRLIANEDSVEEDEATQFLKIERQKLETTNKLLESVQNVATQLSLLTDVMSQIRDVLINKCNV